MNVRSFAFLAVAASVLLWFSSVKGAPADELAAVLAKLDARVIPADSEQGKQLSTMLSRDARARIQAANERETKAWRALQSRADWERYRNPRLEALRASLGQFPEPPKDLKVRVTRSLEGEGYVIENLVFESRPGLLVMANLYRPSQPPKSMPGILICHSHHSPKTQGELQDMGMTWARLGCLVLVMDQLGHGERRQHPFRTEKDYAGSFRPTRQDYYFRYNSALQLHVIGESLIGWMAWDMMRGVDLLLARPGIDRDRIMLLGAVAGGGDPAAVTAALDPRIAAVVPFNFGGPQPETVYPLPADAEASFNYAGGGSWESTRNLRLSARDGFLPWVIVGSTAPRRLVYAHEFAWHQELDPVWKRFETIWGWYGVPDHRASQHGRGSVRGQAPESTHCNNIGAEHRKGIYPAFERWFGMQTPAKESQQRRPSGELLCLTPDIKPRPLHELAAELGAERAAAARHALEQRVPSERRMQLRRDWTRLLGEVAPVPTPRVHPAGKEETGGVTVEKLSLEIERDIVVPLLLLVPPKKGDRASVVVAFSQEGKEAFLRNRAEGIAELLRNGVTVCLPDLRGIGETRPGDGRGRSSSATSISATEQMLGQTLLGARLRDLRTVVHYLRQRADLRDGRLALWGDSFAPPNPFDRDLAVPLDAAKLPEQSEPLGGLLALLGALFEDQVTAVHAHGGLASQELLLRSPFCYVPHDAVVPGALTIGDIGDVVAALAPRPVRLTGLVDGFNRTLVKRAAVTHLTSARMAYDSSGTQDRLVIQTERLSPTWLSEALFR